MDDWFYDHSLSLGKYYTSLSKSQFSTICYCINKEINILHHGLNNENVSDISHETVMVAPSSFIVIVYKWCHTGQIQNKAMNSGKKVPQKIFHQ